MAFFSPICLLMNANILINKSDISGLKQEQMVASLVQNIDKIKQFKEAAIQLFVETMAERIDEAADKNPKS